MGAPQSSGSTSRRPEWHRFSSHNSNAHRAWLETAAVTCTPWDSFVCLERLGFPAHSFWHGPSRGGQEQEGQWPQALANAPGTGTPPSLGSHSTERWWSIWVTPCCLLPEGPVLHRHSPGSSASSLGGASLKHPVLGTPQMHRAHSLGLPLSPPRCPERGGSSAAPGSAPWGTRTQIPA